MNLSVDIYEDYEVGDEYPDFTPEQPEFDPKKDDSIMWDDCLSVSDFV